MNDSRKGMLKLNGNFKYAADKELILKLANDGCKFKHISEYWSTFGIDGENLSTHSGVNSEVESIRLQYGAYGNAYLRSLVLLGRRFERLLSGCYFVSRIQYDYAIDEIPSYVSVEAENVGGRYNLSNINGRESIIKKK